MHIVMHASVSINVISQPYKEHAEYLSQQLSHYEFEVVLGVRLVPSTAPAVPDLEDVQDIDCHLSSLGFEFVDTADSDTNRHGEPAYHLSCWSYQARSS